MLKFLRIERPTSATLRSSMAAASITCWTRWMFEANEVTMIRPSQREKVSSRAGPTLDSEGELGIKTVDADGKVIFHRISIAQSGTNGVWITGLPDQANIIVVGQGYVSAGQSVKAVPAKAVDPRGAGQTAILRP